MKRLKLATGLIVLFSFAQPVLSSEQTHWAKKAQNPLADQIKYPIRTQLDFGYGHKNSVNYKTALQPSMSSAISPGWNLINRVDVPFQYQPGRTPGEKDSFGLGDVSYESFYTPSRLRKLKFGFGPAFQIPTATDPQLGTRKWSAGLATAANWEKNFLVTGARANHLWSFAGKSNREDVNRTTFEYWVYANLGSGWWIGTSPINVADWDVPSENRWTIPVGGGLGRVVGQRIPLNLKLEAYKYVEIPNDLADWTMMFTIEFIIPENAPFKR